MTTTETKTMDQLIEKRNVIVFSLGEPGAYPGTKAWRWNQKMEAELQAFDEAHPEVIKEINKRDSEERRSLYSTPDYAL